MIAELWCNEVAHRLFKYKVIYSNLTLHFEIHFNIVMNSDVLPVTLALFPFLHIDKTV